MAKNKKKKRKPGAPRARFFIPAPLPEEGNPMPSAGDGGVELIVKYAERATGEYPVPVKKYIQMHHDLYVQYNAVATGRFEAEKGKLSRMDTIDVSGQSPIDPGINHDTVFSAVPNPILACTPCYEKGVLRIDANLSIYFEVLSLDLDAKAVSLYVHAFRQHPDYENQVEPGVSGTIDVDIVTGTDGKPKMHIVRKESEPSAFFTDIYVAISPKELGWTAEEADYWQKVVVQNAANQLQRYRRNAIDPVENMGRQFCAYISVVNAILERSRPKLLPDDAPETKDPEPGRTPAKSPPMARPAEPYDPDKPRVRVVQGVRFISRKPPRRAAQAARQYKTPAWTVRGHTRTYKSGKTAYIKPGVRRRKGLADGAPQQSIIRIDGFPKEAAKEEADGEPKIPPGRKETL